ncbi:MAG: hypothetical protein AB7O80_25330 [Acetobacteraceae bacterium]
MDSWNASWIGGLTLIGITIAMHAIGLVFLARVLQIFRDVIMPYRFRRRANAWVAVMLVGLSGAALAMLHAAEAAVWAIAYMLVGAMENPSDAILYSIDSMTTRGASGLQLQQQWRLMGALESADGMLLFGISTAFLFAIMQHVWPVVLAQTPKDVQPKPSRQDRR